MNNRRCQIEGCTNNYYAKGFCMKHYQKNRLLQKTVMSAQPGMERQTVKERICQEPGCDKKQVAKGLCATHYQRNRLQSVKTAAIHEISVTQESGKPLVGKVSGVVRELDSLGRIVLPIELRRVLNIEVMDSLEIFVDNDTIILRKYAPGCVFCGTLMNDTFYFKGKLVCKTCIGESATESSPVDFDY
ncbi:AbrB/MazE/SpoVT family DNA-binding domain-containing protein [Brevibacillus borstelensis]|uniref:AbrB/MazE/SpoVT family DNA-binding domain-containing protein n=1 Tax=Brevibacillus borstelensis TaxID=45462 RepID=UPI000A5DB2EE